MNTCFKILRRGDGADGTPGNRHRQNVNSKREDRNFRAGVRVEDYLVGNDGTGVDMLGRPPDFQPSPRQMPEQQKAQSTRQRSEVNDYKRETAITIGDQLVTQGRLATMITARAMSPIARSVKIE
jgi:hypothetical protein